jgi:flagellar biogenesis protein FliO
MEIIGFIIFLIFFVGFMRMDSNLIKIRKSLENIEKAQGVKKEKN